jgi:hypothetical protein
MKYYYHLLFGNRDFCVLYPNGVKSKTVLLEGEEYLGLNKKDKETIYEEIKDTLVFLMGSKIASKKFVIDRTLYFFEGRTGLRSPSSIGTFSIDSKTGKFKIDSEPMMP